MTSYYVRRKEGIMSALTNISQSRCLLSLIIMSWNFVDNLVLKNASNLDPDSDSNFIFI
jgi:hypothetical protein